MIYDICIIGLVDIQNDARILNFSHTLLKNNFRVCILGYFNNSSTSISGFENLEIIPIEKPKIKRTFFRWISFYLNTIKFKNKISAKAYLAADLYSLPSVVRFAGRNKSKVIYDSREIFSALGPLESKPFKQQILKLIENYFINQTDEVIVSGVLDAQYLKNYLKKHFDYNIILNLPPYQHSVKSNKIREHFNLHSNSVIFLYQGMIHDGRGIASCLEIAKIVNNYLVIIGDGPYKQDLLQLILEKGLDDKVLFTGVIDYKDLHFWTSSADVGLCMIEPISDSYNLALPNKLFEYIMARIPVLCSDLPAMREIIHKYKVGELIDPELDNIDIINKANMLIRDKEIYKKNCEYASEQLSYEIQEDIILKLIK